MSVKSERDRQNLKVQRLYDYLLARRGEWVSAVEMAPHIGTLAVSTKISQARELAEKEDFMIVWNHDQRNSCYMLRPKSLGPSAETDRTGQRTLPGIGISSLHGLILPA